MAQRITSAHLDAAVARFNALTKSPAEAWTSHELPDGTKRFASNIGHWHINSAYAMVQLARMHNTAGGVETFGGFGTKRDILARVLAMIDGFRLAEKVAQ